MARYTDTPWWDRSTGLDPHVRLIPVIREIRERQQGRYTRMRKMQSVYEYGFAGEDEDVKLNPNAAKNAIDTVHAALITPRIAPMLLTEGGTWGQRDKAKKATKALEGVFDENDVEELKEDVTLDALTAFNGFAHVYSEVFEQDGVEYGEVKIARVMPDEVGVDDAEGLYRTPRCIYRWQNRDRYKMLHDFGEPDDDLYGSATDRRKAIRKAKAATVKDDYSEEASTQIEVFEAWHLPSGPVREGKKHDGRHVICIDGCTLVDEPWDRANFPLLSYRAEKARRGYWGLALMRQAMAGQREFEEVTRKLQRAHRRMGGVHMMIGNNADADLEEFTGGQGTKVRVKGDINQLRDFAPTPANPQTYQYREQVAADILRYMGVSQFAAQSEVPAGLQQASGKALQKFQDTNDKRGIGRHRALERFIIQLSQLVLDEVRALLKAKVKVVARYRDKRGFEVIDWKDIIDVFDDQKNYVIRIFPVGMLSQDPSAKFAELDRLLELQVINIEQFKRLYEIPDIEAENDIECADYEVIDKNLDYMVTTGKYVDVQPFDNWALIVTRGGKFYNACRIANVPDARLELIRRYTVAAQDMIAEQERKQAAAMPPMPMAGPPMNDALPPGGAPPVDAMPLPMAS